MRVGILGSGLMGGKLGTLFTRAGTPAGDLSGKVLVSRSLPLNADNTELVPSEALFGAYDAKRKSSRPSLVYCGDDESAKGVAAELIRNTGFDPVDAGPLRMARYTEPFALRFES